MRAVRPLLWLTIHEDLHRHIHLSALRHGLRETQAQIRTAYSSNLQQALRALGYPTLRAYVMHHPTG